MYKMHVRNKAMTSMHIEGYRSDWSISNGIKKADITSLAGNPRYDLVTRFTAYKTVFEIYFVKSLSFIRCSEDNCAAQNFGRILADSDLIQLYTLSKVDHNSFLSRFFD